MSDLNEKEQQISNNKAPKKIVIKNKNLQIIEEIKDNQSNPPTMGIKNLDIENTIDIVKLFENTEINDIGNLAIYKIPNVNISLFKANDILERLGYKKTYMDKHIGEFFADFEEHELIKYKISKGYDNYFLTEQGVYSAISKVKFSARKGINDKGIQIAKTLHKRFMELIELVRRTNPNLYYGVMTNNTQLLSDIERKEYEEMKQENTKLKNAFNVLHKSVEESDEAIRERNFVIESMSKDHKYDINQLVYANNSDGLIGELIILTKQRDVLGEIVRESGYTIASLHNIIRDFKSNDKRFEKTWENLTTQEKKII